MRQREGGALVLRRHVAKTPVQLFSKIRDGTGAVVRITQDRAKTGWSKDHRRDLMTLRANLKIAGLVALLAVGGGAVWAKSGGHAKHFGEIDADGNGQVTQEELKAHASARFAKADTDGDGQLSPEEMAQRGKARRAKRAQKMMERLDTDGNGKLSQEELMARRDPAKLFQRLDADGNGTLSAEEFANARHRGKGHGKKPKSE